MGSRDKVVWMEEADRVRASQQLRLIEAASFPSMAESDRALVLERLRRSGPVDKEEVWADNRAELAAMLPRKGKKRCS